jgi:hypothetical protein
MKLFYRAGLRLMMTLSLCLFITSVSANDYLEEQSNYSVYATGRDAIHVKVPIWAYGRVNNYYLSSNSYLYFQEQGSSDVWYAVWFQADAAGGKKTFKAYLWMVCGDAYDAEHPRD